MSTRQRWFWDIVFIVAVLLVSAWMDWRFIRKVASTDATAARLEALERRVDALERGR